METRHVRINTYDDAIQGRKKTTHGTSPEPSQLLLEIEWGDLVQEVERSRLAGLSGPNLVMHCR
jgi:hypothetical protein